ncbi:MAG: hypothetical protein U0802_23500 [Candidatus Binatia bacterium]
MHGDAGRFPAVGVAAPRDFDPHQRRLRYLFDNGLNWVWFLHVNALARALGLNAFKDVFLSDRAAEPYAEVEALLAALAAGPVGIGDAIGRADRDLVMRTCREDGVLVKPDAPLAAIDRCFQRHGHLDAALTFGETISRHGNLQWVYVVGLHASRHREAMTERVSLADLGAACPGGPVVAYDWHRRSFAPRRRWRLVRDPGVPGLGLPRPLPPPARRPRPLR